MASITKPVLLAVIGILAVVLFLQTSNLITGNLLGSHDEALNVTLDADIDDAAPTVSGVTLEIASPDNPCGTDTVSSYCTFTVDDPNGYVDLSAADVDVFAYFAGDTDGDCTADDANCYEVAAPTCTNSSANATRTVFNCTFDMEFFADNGTWTCNATASDSSSTDSGEDNDTRSALRAINLAAGIDWGSLSVDAEGEATNDIRNCGNRPLDANINASTMTCDGTGSVDILAGNITVGPNGTLHVVTLSSTLQKVDTDLAVETDGGGDSNQTTYWNLTIPNGVSGSCSGTAYVVGIEDA